MRIFTLLLALTCLLACQRERVWVEPDKSEEADPNALQDEKQRVIVCAPAAMDKILDIYGDAPRGYAKQVINWLKPQVGNARFIYGPSLPPADDERWNQGPYAGAAGAHVVVLVSLTELKVVDSINAPSRGRENVEATVEIRLLNRRGEEIWSKTNMASISNERTPKFRGSASPTGRAVWNANFECIRAMKDFFDAHSDKDYFGEPVVLAESAPPLKSALVSFVVASEPHGADVLVDGVFKGNTPMTLELPAEEVELRIERAGYQPWSRKLVPSATLQIKPLLTPKP